MRQLAPAPRPIPPLLAAQMLMGGANTQIGWLFLAFGSLTFWAFAWSADLSGWRFRPEATGRIEGHSAGCRITGFSEGGTRSSKGRSVYRNLYRYAVNGGSFKASSYATRCVSRGAVVVEYLTAQPGTSRIVGMRRTSVGPWGLAGTILPAIGLGIVIAAFLRGRRALRLLRTGEPVGARLVLKTPTGSRIMNRLVYRMTFSYTVNGVDSLLSARPHEPERLEDDREELLLCDPHDCRDAVLVGNLPGVLNLDAAGRPAPPRSFAFLLLPAITVVMNTWIVYRLGHA